MSHMIEIRNDAASMAYNGNDGDPWHRLGTRMDGYSTPQQMLEAAQADFDVTFCPIYVQTPNGMIVSETHQATVRTVPELTEDGVTSVSTPLGITGMQYTIDQNADTTEWAMALAGAARTDAVIDTMAVTHGGKRFFVSIAMGSIVLDPDGIADTIKRFVIAQNAHDMSLSLRAFNSNIRPVCDNTVTWAYQEASLAGQVHTVRHTSGKEQYKAEAVKAMGLADKVAELFNQQAMALLQAPGGTQVLSSVSKALWPKPDAGASTRAMNAWNARRGELFRMYESPKNSGGFGDSGWTVYNTIGEYMDHARPRTDATSRALASADPTGDVSALKAKAANLILV